MRIAHVVTLISAENAFGGPVSVAKAQAAELAKRGHDVTLLAGWDGIAHCVVPGVTVQLHRTHKIAPTPGFSGLATPSLWRSLRSMTPRPDVVHVHLARDLVTLGAARAVTGGANRLVTQTHGMVMPDQRFIAKAMDTFAVRGVLRSAHAVATLTDTERNGLRQVGGQALRIVDLPNGIDTRSTPQIRSQGRPSVVFCARLHPRKRVLAFAQVAKLLIDEGADADFVVYGPDEGDLQALLAFVDTHKLHRQLRYRGAVAPDDVRTVLRNADVFVLPSDREPFPMTLLEAMAEGTPAVITDGCMIANRFEDGAGPQVTDGSPLRLAEAVKRLLGNPALAQQVGRRSRELVAEHFSIESVVDTLERVYML